MFLGILAALSIMAVALVALLVNAQHSTSREKSRTTAFDVAEAAIDVSMQLLAEEWPVSEEAAWADDEFLSRAEGFADQFGVTSGIAEDDSVRVLLLDDSDPSLALGWDADDNRRVVVDAQARVNGVSSRIRAVVQADFYELGLAKGVVVYATGDLDTTSMDEKKPVIGVQDVTVGGAQPVSIAVHGVVSDPSVAWPYVDQNPTYKPTRQELLSDETIEDLTYLAQRTGKYFTGQPPSAADWTGLCVVEIPSGSSVQMPQDTFNSVEYPGILLVLGGGELRITGQTEYFGVVYCAGDISFAAGNPIIYGMAITDGSMTVQGSPQVIYREDLLRYLDRRFQTNTHLVPNQWRELTPVTPSPSAEP